MHLQPRLVEPFDPLADPVALHVILVGNAVSVGVIMVDKQSLAGHYASLARGARAMYRPTQ